MHPAAQYILTLLAANPRMTMMQLAKKVGVSRRTIERHIRLLQATKQLRREGATKNGVWRVR